MGLPNLASNTTLQEGTFLDAVAAALTRAGVYNKNDQVAPAAVLWPDGERQWEPLVPRLRQSLPLLTLGAYDPAARTGPAYWLRCMIAHALPEDALPADTTPIIYLPGVSRAELRDVEDSPKHLQPLVELMYRGVFWTHKNGRDWTIVAFLQAGDGGLGIEVAGDSGTRDALQRALVKVADEPVAHLKREAPLRAAFFDTLMNPDEVKSLLLWLNDPAAYRGRVTAGEWESFATLCKRKYGFQPEKDGPLSAAALLGQRMGVWEAVWQRFAEAPRAYPHLPSLLRRARPSDLLPLFDRTESWPQENESAEDELRLALGGLHDKGASEACVEVRRLENQHGPRRTWVWAALGASPLAFALEHLKRLAEVTERIPTGNVPAIAVAYTEWGWHADAAAMAALAAVEHPKDLAAVSAALVAVYRPWLESCAREMQNAVAADATARTYTVVPPPTADAGTCLLFCDSLRMDAGQGLAASLQARGLVCHVAWRLAALPTVTPTAKPAVSPVAGQLRGGTGLDTIVAATGSRVTAEGLRALLVTTDYQVLQGDDVGDPSGRAWTEMGAIDQYGHEHGWKVALRLGEELRGLERRIAALLEAGWRQIIVITDHGWLMLPGGLPKVNLPEHLTEVRKGRCARLKPLAATDQQVVPWHWDSDVEIAVAPGIACYEAGREYEYGGISPQESIVPVLTVSAAHPKAAAVVIEAVKWVGLRCRIRVRHGQPTMRVDIRTRSADAGSSLLAAPKAIGADGQVSVPVADDRHEGTAALVVVLDEAGVVLAQRSTVIGEES
ncbi:MAG: BREX-1 system phosphatase PglZ type B [Anaerolineae bacterium]